MKKIVVLLLFGLLLAGCNPGPRPEAKYVFRDRLELIALSDKAITSGGGVHGSFFLGIGSITSSKSTVEIKYFFYVRKHSGGYKLTEIPKEQGEIFLDEDEHPYVKVYDELNSKCHSQGLSWFCDDKTFALWRFHVPPGSIKSLFELDMQ